MSMPPPNPSKPLPKMLWQFCSHCGVGEVIASGYVAQVMTIKKRLELLRNIGWQTAPKLICKSCLTAPWNKGKFSINQKK